MFGKGRLLKKIVFYSRGQERLVEEKFIHAAKEGKFLVHYRHFMIPFKVLKRYLVPEDIRIKLCSGKMNKNGQPCKNFGSSWSCPPLAPTLDQYNDENYQYCLLYCMWINLDETVNLKNECSALINISKVLNSIMWKYGRKLERDLGGKNMISGSCPLCTPCEAKFGRPCKHPKEKRCSMEALGLLVADLCKDFLRHEIKWSKNYDGKILIPKYITCVHGLLTNSLQPKHMLINIEF